MQSPRWLANEGLLPASSLLTSRAVCFKTAQATRYLGASQSEIKAARTYTAEYKADKVRKPEALARSSLNLKSMNAG